MSDTPAKTPMELTASVVAAYVANNTVAASEIPNLIAQVHAALTGVAGGKVEVSLAPAKPAVPLKKSITADYLICLEDGLKFKSLKRHLRTRYAMTPEQYRAKWNLPADYPMVAKSYAATRSQLAKNMGLGRQRSRKGK